MKLNDIAASALVDTAEEKSTVAKNVANYKMMVLNYLEQRCESINELKDMPM